MEGVAAAMTSLGLSLALLLMLVLFWIECRVLAGRPTIGAGKFVIFFGIGSVGATLCAVVIERIALLWMPAATASFTIGPVIEELATAAPLAVIAFWTLGGCRLTVADLALMGVSIGLGFQLVESNLQTMATGALPNFVTPVIPGWVAATDHVGGATVYDVGHAVSTGLVGLAIGVGVRVLRDVRQAQALTVLTLVLVVFDHAMFNWKLAHKVATGSVLAFPKASGPVEALFWITSQGRLELLLLAAGLIGSSWVEGHLQSRPLAAREDLRLPGERLRPTLPAEWQLVLRRVSTGWSETQQALTFLRHRRAYAVALTGHAAAPNHASLWAGYLDTVERRAHQDRDQFLRTVERPSRDLAASLRTSAVAYGRVFRILLIVLAVLVVLFVILRATGAINSLYGRPLALILGLIALAFALWRLRGFRREHAPDPGQADGEAIATHHGHALLTYASVTIGAAAVVFWFLPTTALAPTAGAAFMLGVLDQWMGATGGSPSGLLALGGLAAPSNGTCTDCAAERAAVEAGRIRIAEAEANLAKLREQSAAAQKALDTARQSRRAADDGLRAMDNESYVEGTEGRLAGVRLTTGDLARQRAEEAAIRARRARGEISEQEAQDQLARWADPDYVKSLGQQGEQDRGARRDALQKQLSDARTAETTAVDQSKAADTALGAAADAAAAERAAQDQREAALAQCEGTTPAAPPGFDILALQKEFEDAQKEFEDLENQLRDAMDKQAQDVQKFYTDYNQKLAHAVQGLEAYLAWYKTLTPDLADLFQAYKDLAGAKAVAAYFDKITDALVKIDMAFGAAKLATFGITQGLLPAVEAVGKAGDAALASSAGKLAGVLREGELIATEQAAAKVATAASETTAAESALKGLQATADGTPFSVPRPGAIAVGDATDNAMQYIAKTKEIPGVFDVAVHGGKDGNFYYQITSYGEKVKLPVDNAQIADALEQAGWKPGQPVRLFSCWSGSSGAADSLSEYLTNQFGVPTAVRGPDLKVAVDSAGWIEHGVSGPGGTWSPQPASWKNFTPGQPPQVVPSTAGHIRMPDGSYR